MKQTQIAHWVVTFEADSSLTFRYLLPLPWPTVTFEAEAARTEVYEYLKRQRRRLPTAKVVRLSTPNERCLMLTTSETVQLLLFLRGCYAPYLVE